MRSLLAAGAGLLLAAAGLPDRSGGRQAPDSLYAVTFTTGAAWDTAKAPADQPFFREHSQNLARLRREGRIVMGGRFGAVGLILLRVRDGREARGLFEGDSTVVRGVFRAEFAAWRTLYEGIVPPR